MGADFEEMFGPLVGRGSQAAVYARGDYAVKLYREGYPKGNVFSEAYIMANLERMNFPGPKIYEVLLVDGRYGLRMDRVKGRAMSEAFTDAEGCKKALNKLVDIQCGLQKYGEGMWAPDLKQRFYDDLMRNERLSAERREKLLKILNGLPDGRALCHCDFHADNIFLDGDNYAIIDLLQVSRGDPAADAACSYTAFSFANEELAEYYLNRYCEASGIPRQQVLQWLAVYGGTLLGQVSEELTPIVERFIASAKEAS